MSLGRPKVHVVRDATASPLWQVVHEFFPTLVDYVGRHDQYVPSFVDRIICHYRTTLARVLAVRADGE